MEGKPVISLFDPLVGGEEPFPEVSV